MDKLDKARELLKAIKVNEARKEIAINERILIQSEIDGLNATIEQKTKELYELL